MLQQATYDRLFISSGVLAVLVALALQITAIYRQSLVADEPFFLLSGYRAVHYGTNTLNLEHPPLVKMLAALPLSRFNGSNENPSQLIFRNRTHATYVRLASRFVLLVTVAIPFLIACFLLGWEIANVRVGVVLALSLAFSFDVIPYLTITQTDAAVSLGYVLTLVAAIRFLRQPTFLRASLLGLGFGIAIATKFSGLLLLPSISFALLTVKSQSRGWIHWWALCSVVFAVSLLFLYSTYRLANWNYNHTTGRAAISAYCQNQTLFRVDDEMRPYERTLLKIESIDPMIAQWSTGLVGLAIQNRMGVWTSYAFGEVSSHGWWWFFPALLLIRTSLTLLLASCCALFMWFLPRQSKQAIEDPCFGKIRTLLILTICTYFGMAFMTTYNMGIRHLLPILPILSLPAVLWAARGRLTTCGLVGSLLVEAIILNPVWMSSTNTWWLGDLNPTRCAVISDCEYKQNFLTLASAISQDQLNRLHVAFPLITDAELEAYLPGAVKIDPAILPIPGWHAVSVIVEEFLPAVARASRDEVHDYDMLTKIGEPWGLYYNTLQRIGEDHGYVAGTFHLYYVPSHRS